MVGAPCVAEERTEPIDIIIEYEVLDIGECRLSERIGCLLKVDVSALVFLSKLGVCVPHVACVVVVAEGCLYTVSPQVDVAKLRHQAHGLQGSATAIVDLQLAFLALLGCDEHNTAGSTATVDSSRTVLKEVD